MKASLLDKWRLLAEICADPKLSGTAKAVAFVLLDARNGATADCHPSRETIAAKIGSDQPRVITRAIGQLISQGWLTQRRRRGASDYSFPTLDDETKTSIHTRDDETKTSTLFPDDETQASSLEASKTSTLDRTKTSPLLNLEIETGNLNPIKAPPFPSRGNGIEDLALQNWNAIAKALELPLALKLTPKRRSLLKPILSEYGLAGWNTGLDKLNDLAPFYRGESKSRWRANVDWLLRPGNFLKLLEGACDAGPGEISEFDRISREEKEIARKNDARREAAGLNGRGPIIDHEPNAPKRRNGHAAPTPEEILRKKIERLEGALKRCTNDAARADLERHIQQARKDLGQ